MSAGWRLGDDDLRPERRVAGERRSGDDRRAPVKPPDPPPIPRRPTPRELEVLALVASGCTHAEVARRLGMAEQTVRHHSTNLRARLGVRNLPQAVAEAMIRGWLVPNR